MEFKHILDKVLINEGGYVNNKKDSGGETYKGVARNYHPNWIGWQILDNVSDKNADNRLLDDAIEVFYFDNFWDKIKGSRINDENIAYEFFDTSVNMGVRTATKLMQKCLGVDIDGIIGKKTIDAINGIGTEILILRFKLSKIARYSHLVKKYPKNRVFLNGWINRTLGA